MPEIDLVELSESVGQLFDAVEELSAATPRQIALGLAIEHHSGRSNSGASEVVTTAETFLAFLEHS